MRQLKDGLSRLSSNYNQFHAGLDKYTSGVEHLSDGYGEIDAGIQSLTGGIGKLNTGTEDLYEGTSELNDAVADLPDTIQIEIDEMVKPYDKSDFVPISFVSNKNTSVTTVQFVLKTPSIELPEMLESAVTTPVKLTFWQKLLKLFGFCSAIETELAELHREIEVVSELTKKPIYENARFVVNQDGFNVQLVKLVNRCTWDMIRDRSGENTNKDTFMHKFLAQWPCSENQATDFFNEFYAAKFPLL
jgi:X-X-X-Leu-X-X-Gly heptad repeat protein